MAVEVIVIPRGPDFSELALDNTSLSKFHFSGETSLLETKHQNGTLLIRAVDFRFLFVSALYFCYYQLPILLHQLYPIL